MTDDFVSSLVLSSVDEYRTLLDNLHAAVVVHGADTGILYANATAADLLGLTMAQMTGKTAIDPAWCFTGADGEPMPLEDYPVNRVLTTREPLRNWLVGVNRPVTQDRVWVLCNAYPILKPSGALEQIVVTFIDVSEQRHAEEAKRVLEEQLRHAQRLESIGMLAGGVAHDFNNLLTTMIGACDLLTEPQDDEAERLALVAQIRRSAERASALTRQLLAFSRKQVLQPRRIDLNGVVRDASQLLGRLIRENVHLNEQLAPTLLPVFADPGQIEQVLMNLAVNARDAMPSGGVLTIETQMKEVDQAYASRHADVEVGTYVVLAVSDSGVGMDVATRQRVFEPFFTTKELGKGTGLGLATVYGIVKQSGGHIWLYSEPGVGTTFKIYLPATAGEADAPAIPLAEPRDLSGHEAILVTEDDTDLRTLTALMLRRQGYQVHEAGSADDAIRVFRGLDDTVDLLLTDVVMPRASGRQLARQLTMSRPNLKVLYMSGYTDNAIVHRGMLDEGTNFLPKPFSSDDLLRKVREVLDEGDPKAT